MIHLFIDTNIYLDFYHFSQEDLEVLRSLAKLVRETSEVKLYITEQVVNEFNRNRECKISDALKQFEEVKINARVPIFCEGYRETKTIRDIAQKFMESKKSLLEKVRADIKSRSLKADEVLTDLFSLQTYPINENLLSDAKTRFDLGNPPGKDNSYGDAINWEFLLNNVPDGTDLHFISTDKDYSSPLEPTNFSLFLHDEWKRKRNSALIYYKSLGDFFRKNFPSIKLSDEDIIDIKIRNLAGSNTFDESRRLLGSLSNATNFTSQQLNNLLKVSLQNDQVYNAHIYSPDKIGAVIGQIIKGREKEIEPELYTEALGIFSSVAEP